MQFLYFLESIRTPVLDTFFSAITHLGSETVFIVAALIVYWCVNKKYGYYLMTTGFVGTLINRSLKLACRVPRPWVRDPGFTIVESARAEATGYSFPSGHVQNVTSVFGSAARFSKAGLARIICWVLIALTALSRMYLGVHTPADVLVSLVISTAVVFALWPVFEKSDERPGLLYVVLASFLVLNIIYVVVVNLVAWPADVDKSNLESGIKQGWTLLGCTAAMIIGLYIDRKYINFSPAAPIKWQIPKTLIGLVLALAIKEGAKPLLKLIFGDVLFTNAIRYFLLVMFAAVVWPLSFPWFAKGCPLSVKAKRRIRKALIIIVVIIFVLAILAGLLFWIVTRDSSEEPVETDNCTNPHITRLGVTLLSGHRAGGGIYPENTMMALENCVENGEYTLSIFEFDLRMTADGELVLLHDSTFDRTSNATEHFGAEDIRPGDYTLEQLKELNMGEKFENDAGETPYAGLRGEDIPDGLKVTTLEEALNYLEIQGKFRFIIEIKDSGETGYKAVDKLYDTLVRYGALERTVVGTFNNEVTEYMDSTYPDLPRSAGFNECIEFYICALLGLKRDADDFNYVALQIPTTDYTVNLGTSRVINYAHEHNIAVQYWTINDAEEMARLQSIGADAIMTDYPDLGYEVLIKPFMQP